MKSRDIERSLLKKGFQQDNKDHRFFYFHYKGKRTAIRTKISHGKSDVDDNLISLMARQCKLRTKQFKDLVDCPLTIEMYIKYLVENKLFGAPDFLN